MHKILIAEDDELSRDLLTQLLEDDYKVVDAADGLACIEVAKREHPDLILMDLTMPGMDGWEAIERIKMRESLKAIPIIAVTALASQHVEENAKSAGFDDYITKPIDEVLLFEKLRKLLG